ncbi:1,4-dihydroxy-2-naphthoate octaprenyltransferase [gut metagenome]|uniref:1,4-dihydroxy-2-naphthoate octaprenyltransferase n=1 Tax=gut metagenome TaxID=749906 RepID=J9FTT3_9ZZZZ
MKEKVITMDRVKENSMRAWLLAARPKTLTAALIPVFTASALAFAHDRFALLPAALCVAFAALMQVAANFINDLFDFLKGSDRDDRLGPERACAQGWITPSAMKVGIVVSLILACSVGFGLLWLTGTWWLLLVGLACVVFAFLYTTMLSYCGLGDILVWVFFGLVPVAGTYYVQAGELVPEVGWVAGACALLIDTLLVLNNYRDREQDRISGKRTLIVALGEPFGRYFYLWQGVLAYLCAAMLAFSGYIWTAVLPMFYLLPHYLTWRKMVQIHEGRELNRVLGFTSRNMLTFGLLLTLALCLERW